MRARERLAGRNGQFLLRTMGRKVRESNSFKNFSVQYRDL